MSSFVEPGHISAEIKSAVSAEEASLWKEFKESHSRAARKSLFRNYATYARNIAHRHHRQRSFGDIELTDLCQNAYAGLLEAIDRFDPARGIPFRAFAAHRISGNIRDGIPHLNEMREQMAWRHRIRLERLQSLADGSRENASKAPALEQISEIAMGLALGFMLEGTGLFETHNDDPAIAAATAYDSVVWDETVKHLQEELLTLPERERVILREHYLNGVNFDHLASLLAISKGRISQLHRSALLTLRKRMTERHRISIVR